VNYAVKVSAARLRAFYAVSFAVLGVYLPFFPRWLEARGIQGFAMGATVAAFPTAGLLAPSIYGALGDAFGLRGSLLRAACAAGLTAFVFVSGAVLVTHRIGVVPLVAAVALFSMARTGMIMMADVLTLEHSATAARIDDGSSKTAHAKVETRAYGPIRLWGSAGFLLAVVLGGRLLDPRDESSVPLAIAGLLLAALVASLALPSRLSAPPRPAPGRIRSLVRHADVLLFLAASFFWQAHHSSYDLCFSLHLRDLGFGGQLTGLAWATGVVAEIVLMLFAAPLLSRVGPARLLVVGHAGAVLRWAVLAWTESSAVVFALQPLHAVSFALIWVASLTFIKERAGPGSLVSGQALFFTATALGGVAGMLTWAPAYSRWGGRTVFDAAAAVAAIACLLSIAFVRTVRPGQSMATKFLRAGARGGVNQ
jgi:PPP family 3-phenylpropionic acid transporter